jgi:RNA polymerase sigma factor (sigma-70 family)
MNKSCPPKRYYSADQDIRFRMTEPQEERDLFVKAKAGDEEAREFIIRNHLLWVQMESLRIAGNGLDRDEVVSAGNAALMEAYNRFDVTKGFRFTTYLRPYLQGAIAELWSSKFNGTVPDPSICGGSSARNASLGRSGRSGDLDKDSSEDSFDEHRQFKNGEFTEHDGERIDLTQFNREKLAAAMATLNERETELLTQVYFNELSFADLGRLRGISREAVRASHERIVGKLRKILKESGVKEIV